MLTVPLVTGFKNLVIVAVNHQFGLKLDPTLFDIRLVPHDSKRYIMAIEVYRITAPQLRYRCYLKSISDLNIRNFKLYEDPNSAAGPQDELYATDIDLDQETYREILVHFADEITQEELEYYYYILTESKEVISTEDGDKLVYM